MLFTNKERDLSKCSVLLNTECFQTLFPQGVASPGQVFPLWSPVRGAHQGRRQTRTIHFNIASHGGQWWGCGYCNEANVDRMESGETGPSSGGRRQSPTVEIQSGRQASTSNITFIKSNLWGNTSINNVNVICSLLYRFCLYDVDSDSGELRDQDDLGTAETSLAQILAAPGHKISLNLSPYKTKPGDCGVLLVTAVEISDGTRDRVTIGNIISIETIMRWNYLRSHGSECRQEGSV